MTRAELLASAARLVLPVHRLDRRDAPFRVWVGSRELDPDEFTVEQHDQAGMRIFLAVPHDSVKAGVQLARR